MASFTPPSGEQSVRLVSSIKSQNARRHRIYLQNGRTRCDFCNLYFTPGQVLGPCPGTPPSPEAV